MSDEHNGGPAFAHGNPEQGGDPGMSLRDWFAGQALSNPRTHWEDGAGTPAEIALQAYAVADAMLAERGKS